MTSKFDIQLNGVRTVRSARGLSQSELARRAGLSRQALSVIEAGACQPGVGAALALADALGETVESLFSRGRSDTVAAELRRQPHAATGATAPRVVLARLGGKVVAVEVPPAALSLTAVGGLVERSHRGRAEVESFRSPAEIDATLLVAGCDPGVAILADWLARRSAGVRVVALPASSADALVALRRGRAHVAGVHLRDSRSGEYNLAPARRALGARRALVINFARWELGIATRAGNPLGLRGFEDFARPGLRIVNRPPGSGARAALDEALARCGIAPARLSGHARELGGHLEVAAAIAAGEADAAVTIRVAAAVYGLDFAPVREERYDLVVNSREADSVPVRAMLDALNSGEFSRELGALCAYDTSQTGRVVARPE